MYVQPWVSGNYIIPAIESTKEWKMQQRMVANTKKAADAQRVKKKND